MTINKKFLSSIAALLILIYHVWTLSTSIAVSRNILATFYVGVDIFFFISAFSLADKKINYGSFILNRFVKIYLKFIVLALVFVIYKKLGFVEYILTIIGVNLFIKGGGSFLWFAPAIMIIYLVFPWFCRWSFKYKGVIVLTVWAIIGVLITYLTNYRAMFIFYNRIPIVLIGYYAKKINFNVPNWTGFILLPIGCVLLYFVGAKYPISQPIVDIFYLSTIPFVLGLAILSNYVPKNIVTDWLSVFTFELYGVQVIFAVDLVTELLYLIDIAIVVNILSIVIFLIGGYLFYLAWKYSEKGILYLVNNIRNKSSLEQQE